MNPNTEISKKPQGLKALINSDAMRHQFALALPKHLTVERFTRIAITALTRNPKLLECTTESFMKCLLDLSAMGLEPDGKKAHLIPYRDNRNNVTECTLVVDYKGKVELVRRDPSVVDVQCITIRQNDFAEWINGDMVHKIDPKTARGDVVSTYTRIVWKSGHVGIGEPFSLDDAEHARRSSKSGNAGPWKDHYVEMWKKSNVHRDSKMWPLSPEVQDAMNREDSHFQLDTKQANGRVVESPVFALPATAVDDEPDPIPQPDGEPVMESPVEVSDETERKALLDDIRTTLAEEDIKITKFAPLCRTAGLLADGIQIIDAPTESLRTIHENRLAIAKGAYQP